MARWWLLSLMLVSVPSWALAQSSVPEAEPPSADAPPPLIPAPTEPAPPPPQDELIPREAPSMEPRYGAAYRVPLELLGGALGAALGTLPGGLLYYWSVGDCSDFSCVNLVGVVGGVLLVIVGAPVGMAAGITGGGNLLGGQGHLGAVLGGLLAGGLGGYLFYRGVGPPEWDRAWTYLSISAGALTGGILAYELSRLWTVRRQRSRDERRVQVLPVATMTEGGGVLGGIVGRF